MGVPDESVCFTEGDPCGAASIRSQVGTLADRPAATEVPDGARYFATDDGGGTLWVVSGGAWVQAADPEGTAADAVASLPEWADGIGTALDESVLGFVGVDSVVTRWAGSAGVSDTASETSLLASTLTVADMQLDTIIHLDLVGSITNNTGANRNMVIRLKVAGSAAATWTFNTIPSSATPRVWYGQIAIQAIDFIGARLTGAGRLSVSAAGTGLDFGAVTAGVAYGTFTVGDPLTFDVTAQPSVASASLSAGVTGGTIRRARG